MAQTTMTSSLAVAGPGRPGVTPFVLWYVFTALRPANCQSGLLQNLNCHARACCHLHPRPGIPSQGLGNPSDPKGAWGAAGPTPNVQHQPPGDAGEQGTDRLMSIVLIKERNSTNVFMLTAQWLGWWLVCTRSWVRIPMLCIFFSKTFCNGTNVYILYIRF